MIAGDKPRPTPSSALIPNCCRSGFKRQRSSTPERPLIPAKSSGISHLFSGTKVFNNRNGN